MTWEQDVHDYIYFSLLTPQQDRGVEKSIHRTEAWSNPHTGKKLRPRGNE